jgi:hypothetical protein
VDAAAGFTYTWAVTKNGSVRFGSGTGLIFTPDDNGTYVASLTARDKDGTTSPATTTTITVDNVVPTVSITGAPSSGNVGTPISLGSTVTDPSSIDTAAGFTYSWSVTKNGSSYASGSASALSFTPDADGTYVIALAARDKDGGQGTTSKTVVVGNPAPSPDDLVLLPDEKLAELRQEAAANTASGRPSSDRSTRTSRHRQTTATTRGPGLDRDMAWDTRSQGQRPGHGLEVCRQGPRPS